MIFFENKLLQQPDVVFDSESNGCNFSSLAPPGGEKNIFNFCFQNGVPSRRGRFYQIFLRAKIENIFFLPDGARNLKLRPFDSESKTIIHQSTVTVCFRKKSPLTVGSHSTNTQNNTKFIKLFDKNLTLTS